MSKSELFQPSIKKKKYISDLVLKTGKFENTLKTKTKATPHLHPKHKAFPAAYKLKASSVVSLATDYHDLN